MDPLLLIGFLVAFLLVDGIAFAMILSKRRSRRQEQSGHDEPANDSA